MSRKNEIFSRSNEMKKQEAQRATYRAPEYNVPPFWQIGLGGKSCLLIGLKTQTR